MSTIRPGLGKSLSALLQVTDEQASKPLAPVSMMLSVNALQAGKYQPRSAMDDAGLTALADSIAKQGILQPIVVRQIDSNYEIIAGERRFQASKLAGLDEVPVIIREVNDETAMAIALIENLQREALNAIDEARAIERLTLEFNLTHQEIAKLLSKSRAAVSNSLRLLKLTDEVKAMLERGELEMGHARTLLNLDKVLQIKLARKIIDQKLSVREAEALVKASKVAPKPRDEKNAALDELNLAFNGGLESTLKQISSQLGATVQVKSNASGQGRLWVEFKNLKELKQLISELSHEHTEERTTC